MTEYKSNTTKHMVQFWIRNMEKTFLIFIGWAVLFTLYEYVIIGDGTLADCAKKIPLVMLGGGSVILAVLASTIVKTSIPLAISFGSTRKEAYIGYQISSLLMALQIVASFIVLEAVIEGVPYITTTSFLRICLFYVGLMLAALGIGQVFAMVITKLGAKGATVFLIGILMLFVIGLGIAFTVGNVSLTELITVSKKLVTISVLSGLIAYCIGSVINYNNVKHLLVNL